MAQTRMMVAILRQTSGKSGGRSGGSDGGTRRFRVTVEPHLGVVAVMLELGDSESTSTSVGSDAGTRGLRKHI